MFWAPPWTTAVLLNQGLSAAALLCPVPTGSLLSPAGPPRCVCEQRPVPYLVPGPCTILRWESMNGFAGYAASRGRPTPGEQRRLAFLRKIVQFHAAIRAATEATPRPGPFSSVQLQVKSAGAPSSSGAEDPPGRSPGALPEADNSSQLLPAASCH